MKADLVTKLFNGTVDWDDEPELTFKEAGELLRERLTIGGVDAVIDAALDICCDLTGSGRHEVCEGGDFPAFAHIVRILAPWISDQSGWCIDEPIVEVPGVVKNCEMRSFVRAFRNNRLLGWEE